MPATVAPTTSNVRRTGDTALLDSIERALFAEPAAQMSKDDSDRFVLMGEWSGLRVARRAFGDDVGLVRAVLTLAVSEYASLPHRWRVRALLAALQPASPSKAS